MLLTRKNQQERDWKPKQDNQTINWVLREGKDGFGKCKLKEMTVLLVPKCNKVESKCR